MRKSLWIVLAVISMAIGAPKAQADSFTFTIGGPESGSGTLTTDALSGGSYLVTNITGTFNGSAIVGLLPPGGFTLNDNLLFPASPQLDGVGLSFQTANGDVWNIECLSAFITPCFQPTEYELLLDVGGIPEAQEGTHTFEATPTLPAPEPNSVALILLGIGLVSVMRKRRDRELPQVS